MPKKKNIQVVKMVLSIVNSTDDANINCQFINCPITYLLVTNQYTNKWQQEFSTGMYT